MEPSALRLCLAAGTEEAHLATDDLRHLRDGGLEDLARVGDVRVAHECRFDTVPEGAADLRIDIDLAYTPGDGGCDALYIARRVVRMASEDIGNADPRALDVSMAAWDVQERLGSPEGELAIAQAVVYLAVAPKSNAVYNAFNAAMDYVKSRGSEEVPMHIRNAPTKLMGELGHGAGYQYAHDFPGAYVAGENYLPETSRDARFYQPVDRGLEQRIAEKMAQWRELDAASDWQRYRKPGQAPGRKGR